MYVTKPWSVVLLNRKHIYCYLKCTVYDKLLKPRQLFRITLYIHLDYTTFVRFNTKAAYRRFIST